MAYELPIDFSAEFPDGTFIDGGSMLAEAVINTTWAMAQVKSAASEAKATDVSDAIDALLAGSSLDITAGTVSVPTVTAPGVTIPSSIDASNILDTFRTEYIDLANYLVDKYAGFITTYFQTEADVYNVGEDWLAAAIGDGGIPLSVQQQILGDDHARIANDKLRAQDSIIAQYAGRRFPMPMAAATSALMQLEQKAQDAMAESSRKVSMLTVEMMKFAIEKALDLRKIAVGAAGDYVKSIASGPEIASRMTGIGYDAQSKLISSAAQFYGADTNAKEMMSKVDQWNKTITLQADEKNQATDMGLIDAKLKALLTDLTSLRHETTAMLNNLHANAGLSTSISYSNTKSLDA